tara:strand:+ start:730 stop:1854 length:1125 start_codon:yes stop_codon:yes gene_type:complete
MKIKFLDLRREYLRIKREIDDSLFNVLESTDFIKGQSVTDFESKLKKYSNSKNVITCGNGTDAIQASLMAFNFPRNSEVLIPSFTYIATAEVVSLLGLKPVFVDVNIDTFNIDINDFRSKITNKSVAVLPVNLYGQSCEIEKVIEISKEFNLKVIEDNAQSFGAEYKKLSGKIVKTGTLSHISTTSFFPSKSLGCFGDGGAIFSDDDKISEKIKMICNHGQIEKYYHEIIGINSRLDTIQASILLKKLKILDSQILRRQNNAKFYIENLDTNNIILPEVSPFSNHIYHQFTIKLISNNVRDKLQLYLSEKGIPSVIYYPIPIHHQNAFKNIETKINSLSNSETLSKIVLSLPIHPELSKTELEYILKTVNSFFK